ncbi:LacI family transcriptional regulator [Microlunatus soli]|uniref:LacI family transcriptional regulator n=2 Tax=Microlunatus soli TaxID=630515 RepID=A0A1H1ZJ76_9ACTN|nr:LacI family transcriptional regulator [Microlunatus soli]
MKMVAARAGVSVATVSFVLSGRPSGRVAASAETAERVRAIAEELGYRPNQAARAVRTGRSGLVLLSLTQLSDPWCQSVSQAVSAAASGHRLQPLILADGDWGDVLDGQPVDAAFLDAASADDLPRIRTLVDRGLQLIVFSDDLEPDGFDVIRSPQRPGCELAMAHLLASHSRIGCLTGTDPDRPGWHREHAYLDALQQAGIERRPDDLQRYTRDQVGVYEAALRMLDREDRPTAVFAASDFAAITAINVALRLGLSVPDDLAVVGVGNTEEGALMHPSLTSAGPTDFFASLAELIITVAGRPTDHRPRRHDFPWRVHLRESSPA